MKKLNILIVDDHQLMIEGYKSILQYKEEEGCEVHVTSANNCEEAYKIITNLKEKLDFVFLDWILPPFPNEGLNNGGDLARLIQKYSPATKVIILTSHEEAFELYNIIKKFNPSGLMVKSDFTSEDLLIAIDTIDGDEMYYTPVVKHSIKEINSKEVYLDNFNRQIISLLAKGVKTKSLPDYLPLSLSAIDKRKAQIKDYFLIGKGNDEDIIREAKKAGLI